ncbi:MAG: Crp/Fnr family transcriptional regulator [Candidatus Binatia bacterium]
MELRLEHKAAFLRNSELFRNLPDEAVTQLAAETSRRSYPAGSLLVRKGEPGDSMLVVITGRVKITAVSPRGTELLLNIIQPGQVFGEMALLDGLERCADATAMLDTEVLVLGRASFERFLRRSPDQAIVMMRVLCERIRKTTRLAEDTVFLPLPMRLFRRLQDLAELSGRKDPDGLRIEHGLSQQELAESVASTRETVNRVLSSWQQRELVSIARGSLTIRDLGGLAEAASLSES